MSDWTPSAMSDYEARRWDAIQQWKQQASTPPKVHLPEPVKQKLEAATKRVNEAWKAVPGNENVEIWIARAINGGFQMSLDLINTTIREERIVRRVARKAGRPINALDDFTTLDLRPLDEAAPNTMLLRSSFAAGHGAVSGFIAGGATAAGAATGGMGALPSAGAVAGLAVLDAGVLVAGMIQGSALIGAHYGFDPRRPMERALLLSMLNAGATREAAKVVAMMRVRELALALAAKQTIAQLSQKQLFHLMRRAYALLLLKTAKKNIAKGVPILGAGLGAGLNYAAARQVLDTSRHLCPERFLITKYQDSLAAEQHHVEVIDVLPDDVDDSDRGIIDRLEELPLDEEEGGR